MSNWKESEKKAYRWFKAHYDPNAEHMGGEDSTQGDIYSPLYVRIVDKLKEIHGVEFTYEIWDKHGLNKVSVRCNNVVYKYNFSIVDEDVVLVPNTINKVV
jgi:hypothetical protein